MKITGYTESSGRVLPLGHPLDHPVGDRGDGLSWTPPRRTPRPGARRSPQWVSPLADSEITSSSTPVSRRCRLATIFGSNAAVPVTGHLDLHRPDLGQHRLGPRARCGNCRRHARPGRAWRSPDDRPARPRARTPPPSWSTGPTARPRRSAAARRPGPDRSAASTAARSAARQPGAVLVPVLCYVSRLSGVSSVQEVTPLYLQSLRLTKPGRWIR